MVFSVSDQGRAIFAIVDLNRDRRLGIREIRGAVARVLSWDRNNDGHIRSDEVPHHYQLSIGRGQVAVGGMANGDVSAMMGSPAAANARRRAPTGSARWIATATATSLAASSWARGPISSASTAITTA